MATDLNENSTHEDIQAAVKEIVENRQGEDATPESDAQKIAEERDQPAGHVDEEPTNEDTTQEGETSGEGQEWIDDDLLAEAAAYGVGDDEVAEFTSREEFDRAMKFMSKSALDAGRKALADGESQPRDPETQRFMKKEPESKEDTPKEGGYEVALDPDVYDEGIIKEFTQLRDHYESRLSALESHLLDAAASEQEQRFDAAIDALKHTSLFGKTGNETPKEVQRREAVLEAVNAQMASLDAQGRSGDFEFWVGVMAKGLFADEFNKKAVKARTKQVASQSKGRMSSGGGKPTDPPETRREKFRRLHEEMERAGS